MALQIRVQAAEPGDVSGFASLSAEEYGADAAVADPGHVTWKHLDTPFGASTAVELCQGGQPVGRLWMQPRKWRVNGQPRIAINPVDLLITDEHRDLMSFLRLWRRSAREASDRSDFWYHTSNPVSDELYSKMLHYRPLFQMEGHVCPLRVSALAGLAGVSLPLALATALDRLLSALWILMGLVAGRTSPVRVAEEQPSDAELATLCDEQERQQPTSGERSPASFHWRWSTAAGVTYRVFSVRTAADGGLRGVVVVREMATGDVNGAFVVDVLITDELKRHNRAVWAQMARIMCRGKADALFFFCNRNNAALRSVVGIPWVHVPASRLPQRVPVFFHGLDEDREHLRSAFMTLADFDMF